MRLFSIEVPVVKVFVVANNVFGAIALAVAIVSILQLKWSEFSYAGLAVDRSSQVSAQFTTSVIGILDVSLFAPSRIDCEARIDIWRGTVVSSSGCFPDNVPPRNGFTDVCADMCDHLETGPVGSSCSGFSKVVCGSARAVFGLQCLASLTFALAFVSSVFSAAKVVRRQFSQQEVGTIAVLTLAYNSIGTVASLVALAVFASSTAAVDLARLPSTVLFNDTLPVPLPLTFLVDSASPNITFITGSNSGRAVVSLLSGFAEVW